MPPAPIGVAELGGAGRRRRCPQHSEETGPVDPCRRAPDGGTACAPESASAGGRGDDLVAVAGPPMPGPRSADSGRSGAITGSSTSFAECEHAFVGHPSHDYLWTRSRAPAMSPELFASFERRLEARATRRAACWGPRSLCRTVRRCCGPTGPASGSSSALGKLATCPGDGLADPRRAAPRNLPRGAGAGRHDGPPAFARGPSQQLPRLDSN